MRYHRCERPRALRTAWLVALGVVLGGLAACSADTPEARAAAVQELMDKRDYRAAAITLKAALQKAPNDPALRFQLGRVLMESGEMGGALVELNRSRELGHPEEAVLPVLVRGLTVAGQARAAVDRYAGKVLADRGAQAELKTSLALAYGALGQQAASRQALAEALTLNPALPDARVLEAHFLASEGKLEEAWQAIQGVTAASPGNAGAWFTRAMLERHHKADTAAARESLKKALSLDPRMLLAHTEMLSLQYDAGDRAGMREQLAAMQAALPGNLNNLLFRAHIEFLDGNLKAARDLLQQLMRTNVRSLRVAMLAGQIDYQLGSLALAETHLNTALQIRPEHAPARHLLAMIHMRQGQHAKVLQVLDPQLQTTPPDATALGIAGEALMHLGQLARAQELFDRASQARPDDGRLRAARAVSRMAAGQFEQGLAELEAVAKTDAQDFADLALISALLRKGSTADALVAVQRLQTKLPTQPLPHHLRGQVHLAAGDEPAARQALEAAVKSDPLYFPSVASLAALDLKAGRLEDARARFKAVLDRDPKHLSASLALADIMLRRNEPAAEIGRLLQQVAQNHPSDIGARAAWVEHHIRQRDHRQAVTAAQEALATLPDAPALLDLLGQAQLGTQEYQQAMSTYRKLVTAVPNSPEPHLRIAAVHLAQKDRAAARSSLRRALEVAPDLLPAQIQLVDLALADNNTREALALARGVQRARPKEATGSLLEARVHESQRTWSAAASSYRAALGLQPSTEAVVGLHRALLRLGDAAGATRLAEQWRAEHPKDSVFVQHLGDVALQSKRWAEAESYYRTVIASVPESLQAHNNLAWALIKQGKPGATDHARKAVAQMPGNAAVIDTLANALIVEDKAAEGLRLAEEALASEPSLQELRLTIAKASIRLGNTARAKKELEGLLYLGDRFAEQQEVAALMRGLQ